MTQTFNHDLVAGLSTCQRPHDAIIASDTIFCNHLTGNRQNTAGDGIFCTFQNAQCTAGLNIQIIDQTIIGKVDIAVGSNRCIQRRTAAGNGKCTIGNHGSGDHCTTQNHTGTAICKRCIFRNRSIGKQQHTVAADFSNQCRTFFDRQHTAVPDNGIVCHAGSIINENSSTGNICMVDCCIGSGQKLSAGIDQRTVCNRIFQCQVTHGVDYCANHITAIVSIDVTAEINGCIRCRTATGDIHKIIFAGNDRTGNHSTARNKLAAIVNNNRR